MTVGREGLMETHVEIRSFLGLAANAGKRRCLPAQGQFWTLRAPKEA